MSKQDILTQWKRLGIDATEAKIGDGTEAGKDARS